MCSLSVFFFFLNHHISDITFPQDKKSHFRYIIHPSLYKVPNKRNIKNTECRMRSVLLSIERRNVPSETAASSLLLRAHSVTRTIFPSIFPPLVHKRAVKLWLSQSDVDVVVKTTEPLRKSVAAAGLRLIGLQSAERKSFIYFLPSKTPKYCLSYYST